MISMGDYSLFYHQNANQISILLPQSHKTTYYTTQPTSDRRTKVADDELFPVLAMVKIIFEKKEEDNHENHDHNA